MLAMPRPKLESVDNCKGSWAIEPGAIPPLVRFPLTLSSKNPVGIADVSAVGNGNGVGGRAASIDVLDSTGDVALAIRDENTCTGERNRSIRSAGKDLAIGDKSILAVQAGHTVLAYRRRWLNAGAAATCGRQQTSGCRESEEQAFHRTPRSACF